MDGAARLIREARLEAGLSQSELAKRAGTSQPTVAAYESGTKIPGVGTLTRLLEATGRTLTSSRSFSPRALRESLREHRDEILSLARRHRARSVRAFGSVARGDETLASDIDLLVEFEPGASLLDQVRLTKELERLLGVRVDVVSEGGLRPDDESILRDAIPL